MEKTCCCISNSLNKLLAGLEGKQAIIISAGGEKEMVEIEGVCGDILISSVKGGFKFTDISCLCSVIASCDTLLDTVFSSIKHDRKN
jgi:predicted CDP-diglyceride synthetase/phosphatidate cytidylyltransferase